MLQILLLKLFLMFHDFYEYLYGMFFRCFGTVILIYHSKDNRVKNITLNYYFGYNLDKFKSGTFYAKIYGRERISHIAFDGDLLNIQKIKKIELPNKLPKRKNVILMNNGTPISVDLEILDNYRTNMEHFGESSVRNLGKILELIGLKCTHVAIIQLMPFEKKIIDVYEVDIEYLYVAN